MKRKNEALVKILITAAVLVLFVLLDQWTKQLAVLHLKGQADVVLIKNALVLHYLENSGMAFGLFRDRQTFFYIMTAVILAVVLYMLVRTPLNRRFLPLYLALSVLTAGAVGNLIDRIRNRYVVDFIYVSLIDFPVFNVADMLISVMSVVIVILLIFVYKDEEMKQVYGKKVQKEDA